MKQAAGFFNHILERILIQLGLRPPAAVKKTPEMLDTQVLAQVFSEARFLQEVFKVEVHELEQGEEAGPPRPAGDFEVPPMPSGQPAQAQAPQAESAPQAEPE